MSSAGITVWVSAIPRLGQAHTTAGSPPVGADTDEEDDPSPR